MMEIATEIPQPTEIPDVEAQDPYVLWPAEQSELLAGHPWSRASESMRSLRRARGRCMLRCCSPVVTPSLQ